VWIFVVRFELSRDFKSRYPDRPPKVATQVLQIFKKSDFSTSTSLERALVAM